MGNRGAAHFIGAGATAEITTEESVKGLVSVVRHFSMFDKAFS